MKYFGEVTANLAIGGVATVVAIITFTLSYLRWLLKPRPLKEFPHNPASSILGDIPEIRSVGGTFLDYIDILIKRHGPVVQLFVGNQIFLLVADRGELERLVTSKNLDISQLINDMWSPLVPTGQVALPTNAMWKHHRRVLGPSMHRRYLDRMTAHINNAANSLANLWKAKLEVAGDSCFSVAVDLRQATMDSIAMISIGSPFGCTESAMKSLSVGPPSTYENVLNFVTGDPTPIYRAIDTLIVYAGSVKSFPFPSVTIPLYMKLSPTWRRESKLLRKFLLDKLDNARQQEETLKQSTELVTDADCVLDMLVQQETREGSEPLETDELIDELISLLIAGQETAASVLAWFVKYMPTDPDIQRRLHDEVCAVFGQSADDGASLTLNILSDPEKMPVLEAVTIETLRCAQVVGALLRRLIDDDVVMGKHVPKSVAILIPTGHLGNQESDWGADAETWRPTRWLKPDGRFDKNAGPDGSPFGMGPRACFGQRLAVIQLKIFIVIISRTFFFKPVPAEINSWDADMLASRQPKQCYVALERWEP